MEFSTGLAIKALLGTTGIVGTGITGYLVWENVINTGLTKWDNDLLELVKSATEITNASPSDKKLKISVSEANSTTGAQLKTITTTIEVASAAAGTQSNSMSGKTWKCLITGKTEKTTDTIDVTTQLTQLKKSLGVDTSPKTLNGEEGEKIKGNLDRFIKYCAKNRPSEKIPKDDNLTSNTIESTVSIPLEKKGDSYQFEAKTFDWLFPK